MKVVVNKTSELKGKKFSHYWVARVPTGTAGAVMKMFQKYAEAVAYCKELVAGKKHSVVTLDAVDAEKTVHPVLRWTTA